MCATATEKKRHNRSVYYQIHRGELHLKVGWVGRVLGGRGVKKGKVLR